jgi:uncharacterized protein (TIGR02449 family)
MATNRNHGVEDSLKSLEQAVHLLVRQCARLQEENGLLHEQLRALRSERANNRERNEMVKQKVERMISHLRTMGHHE